MKLMVLDGNSLVNRAFFGIKLLTTKDGRYTNAIYGFQNILLNLMAAHKHGVFMSVVLDVFIGVQYFELVLLRRQRRILYLLIYT